LLFENKRLSALKEKKRKHLQEQQLPGKCLG